MLEEKMGGISTTSFNITRKHLHPTLQMSCISFVGHMFFKCDEMRLSSVVYR